MAPSAQPSRPADASRIWVYGATNASELSGTPLFFHEQLCVIARERKLSGVAIEKIALTRVRRLPFGLLLWMLKHGFRPKAYHTFKLSGLYQTISFNSQQGRPQRGDVIISFTQIVPDGIFKAAASGDVRIYSYIDLTLQQYFKTYRFWNSIPKDLTDELVAEEARCYQVAKRIFCFHEAVKQSLCHDYGVSPSKVVVTESGANLSSTQIRLGRDRRANRVDTGGLTLGFIGKDFQRKGLLKIVAAIDSLEPAARDRIALHVIGPAPSAVPRRSYIKAHGFVDKLNDFDHFLEIVAQCDFGVLLSEAEGFPGSILEFLSLGIPVITSDLEQVVTRVDQKGSYVVAQKDCIPILAKFLSSAASNRTERAQLEALAVAHRDDYTWHRPAALVMDRLSGDGCFPAR